MDGIDVSLSMNMNMSRLNIFLLILVVICGLSVVNATYQQRHLFIEIDRLHNQERQLEQEGARLQYQEGAWSKTSRIEKVAVHQLKMQALTDERVHYWEIGDMRAAAPVTTPQGAGAK